MNDCVVLATKKVKEWMNSIEKYIGISNFESTKTIVFIIFYS